MRPGLIAVARRPRASEKLVDQHTRARARVAVDHEAGRVGERGLDGVLYIAAFEARVASAKHEALQALPAFHQREAGAEKMRIVDAGLRIDEVHRCKIAFAALGRRNAPEAADRN